MSLMPHSEEWYIWLSERQQGYYYPGKKIVSPWHGDDNFKALVSDHLKPEIDVLEVACAQGNLALEIAPHVHSVLGYDATPGYIDLARKSAKERGITNATFLVHNARSQYHNGEVRTPAEDHSIDLWVNSLGPFHPIKDAPRVCRPGAVMLMLVPGGGVPAGACPMPWKDLLLEPFRSQDSPVRSDTNWAYTTIQKDLAEAGLRIHSWWDFDVPYYIPDPRELFTGLAWVYAEDDIPAYKEVEPTFERIFKEFAGPQGLENRWRRSIWKAVIPG